TDSTSSGGYASGEDRDEANSWGESLALSSGTSSTWTESESETESQSSILIPIMGKELAHVQFRSLDEQIFRSMAVLFDQKERHGVARIVGMSAPVSIVTPEVHKMPASAERTKKFLERHYAKLPFALSGDQARKEIADREQKMTVEFLQGVGEPKTIRRKIVGTADEPVKVRRKIS
ncbi:MAG TPA: hypothetical protein VJT54_11015, partial [Verrucomicrobiae bacterium]|nr:hypothetical protein [Verrucomicrobiae bacterium]